MRRRSPSEAGSTQVRVTDVGAPVSGPGPIDPQSEVAPGSRTSVAALAGVFLLGVIAIWVAAYQDSSERAGPRPTSGSNSAPNSSASPTTTSSTVTTTTSSTVPPQPSTTLVGDGWEAIPVGNGFWLDDVVELEEELLAIGFREGRPAVLGSRDGLRWSTLSTDLPDGFSVALQGEGDGGARLVLVRGDGQQIAEVWRSDDGRDWEFVQSVGTGLTDIRDAEFSDDAVLVVGLAADPALDPIDGARAYLAERLDLVVEEEICGIDLGTLTLPENEGRVGFTLRSCAGEVLGEVDRNADMPPGVPSCLTDVAVARREAVSIATSSGTSQLHLLPLFSSAVPPVAVESGFVVSSLGGRAAFEAVKGPCFGAGDPTVRLYGPEEAVVDLDPGPIPDDPNPGRRPIGWFVQPTTDDALFVQTREPSGSLLLRRSTPPYDSWVDANIEAGLPGRDGRLLVRGGPEGTMEIARVRDPEGIQWINTPVGFPLFSSDDAAYVITPIDGRDHLVRVPLP